MNIRFKKISDKAKDPLINEDGSISIFATDLQQAVDQVRRAVLVYHTGLEITLESGYNAIVTPGKYNVTRSVSFESDMIYSGLEPNALNGDEGKGNAKEFVVEYKINTDVLPVAYQQGAEIARLYPIKKESVSLDIDEYVEPASEEPKSEKELEAIEIDEV